MQKPPIDWPKIAQLVLLSRELDLLEEQQLAPQGKIKYQFSAKGHELSQILLAFTLTHPHDAAALYYRSRPFMLASGLTPSTALAAGMARSSSVTQGRDTGVVFNLLCCSSLTILPASGDVGAQYTPAAGWAQAILYHQQVLKQDKWQGSIAVAHGGDGGDLVDKWCQDGLGRRRLRRLKHAQRPLPNGSLFPFGPVQSGDKVSQETRWIVVALIE